MNSYTVHLFEKLEQTFGSEVMLLALSKLGVNVHNLLLGISVEDPFSSFFRRELYRDRL